MACNIREFREKKTREAVAEVYNPQAIAYRLSAPNSIVITPKSSSKIKTVDQAYRAAEAMEKKIAKKFGKKYRFDVYGKWTTIHKNPSGARVEINIPPNLLKAYQVKDMQTKNDYFATDTAVNEQQELDFGEFFDMPIAQIEDQINAQEFINYKTTLISKAESKIRDLRAIRKQKYSSIVSAKIATLENLKEKLQEDVDAVQKTNTIVLTMADQINQDIETLDSLLESDDSIDDLHSAEEIISFYINMVDYKSNSGNKFLNLNEIYDKDNNLVLDKDIQDLLDETLIKINQRYSKLGQNKKGYLQKLIDNSVQIQKLQSERRKEDPSVEGFNIEELLENFEDITWMDENFLTIDKQFGKRDSLLAQLMKIELEMKRSTEKSKSADLIKAIDVALEKATNSLRNISVRSSIFNRIVHKDFTAFYQKSALGKTSGVLINKYTAIWDIAKKRHFNSSSIERRKGSIANRNKANKMDFDWIDANANFLDITKVPAIIRDPQFTPYMENIDEAAAEIYEQEVIAEIGEEFYNRMVQEQIENLIDFDAMPYGLKSYNNPFSLLKSKELGYGGRVYINAQEVNVSPKYNSYFPKKETEILEGNQFKTVDSGYYDENFNTLEQDPALFELWKAFEKGAEYINDTITDSKATLQHGSILSMQKSLIAIILKKGERGRKIEISEWMRNNLREIFTHTKNQKNASEGTTINKNQFKTNQEKVNKRIRTFGLKLMREHKLAANEPLDLLTTSQQVLDFLALELNTSPNRNNLTQVIGVSTITPYALANMYISDQVSEENSVNLPVLMRAYIEMTAEYKAQKDSQPQIEVYKQFYDNIKKKKVDQSKKGWAIEAIEKIRTTKIVGLDRTKAKKRLDYWYNKNVKGTVDSPHPWIVLGSSYEKHDKALILELEESMKDPSLSQEQKDNIQNEIDHLGMNITLSAAFNAVVNKFTLFRGLAFSVKSSTINRFQGWFQGVVNDEKYLGGNFDVANNFITRKILRFSPLHKTFRQEMKKTQLMINMLNILQDATNEMDRAADADGKTGWKKKVSPYYLTEYTEWHNQTPQILAMLMDMNIEDENGNVVPIFTGKEFPAHEIRDGRLVLKKEFANKEGNIETWQNLSNADAANNKLYMSEVIGIINGDYSKTGSVKAKKSFLGRSAMLFKSWLPNYVWNRIASGQANLILGKPEIKGIYTSHRMTTLGLGLGTAGLLASGLVGLGVGVAGGMAIAHHLKKRNDPSGLRDDINTIKETLTITKALLARMGTPINMLTGNRLWKKKQDLSAITISETDKQNLNAILTELSVLISLAMFKVMMQSMIGNDDEEEPKTLPGGTPNPYYFNNIQSDEVKMLHNLIENESSRLIGDIVGIQSSKWYLDTYKNFQVARLVEDTYKLVDALHKLSKNQDKIPTGINAGESRVGNAAQKLLLPGIFQSPLTIGYEKSMEQEYKNREFFDTYFYSDYKKDRINIKADRTSIKDEQTATLQESFGYNEKDAITKKILDDIIGPIVNDLVEALSPYPNRILYDKEQKKRVSKKDTVE